MTWRWSARARISTSCTALHLRPSINIRASSFQSASPVSISCTGSSTCTSRRSLRKISLYTSPIKSEWTNPIWMRGNGEEKKYSNWTDCFLSKRLRQSTKSAGRDFLFSCQRNRLDFPLTTRSTMKTGENTKRIEHKAPHHPTFVNSKKYILSSTL